MIALERAAFETVAEPRVPAISRLVQMLVRHQTSVLQAFALVGQLPFVAVGAREVVIGPLASAGTVTVQHGFRRPLRGWLALDVVRAAGATGALSIYRRAGDESTDDRATFYVSDTIESARLLVWP